MKNLKSKSILVIALSLVLLIGSVIGITVSAQDGENTYAIKSINIAYGDKAYVLMAVDASVEDAAAGNVEVLYTIGETDYIATYWPELTANAEKNPSGLPVFYTVGIAPKDIGEDIIAEAHVKGAAEYTPDYENVSLAEYLYHMLYAKGRINATAEKDLHAKAVYETLLAYGAAAQQYFWNDKAENEGKQRELVTNRSYVYVDGATINETGENELLLPGKTGTVTLLPEATNASWDVTTYDENGNATTKTVIGNEISITGHTVITAAATTLRGHGEYASDSRTESYESFTATSNSRYTVSDWNGTTKWTKLQSDVEGNYLNVGRNGADNGELKIKMDTSDDLTRENTYTKLIFETDIMWGGSAEALYGQNICFLRFYDSTFTNIGDYFTMPITADGKLTVKDYNASSVATLDVGTWYNLRIEIIDNKVSLYLNGALVSSASPFSTSNDMNVAAVVFSFRTGSAMGSASGANNAYELSLDNTFAARVAADNARGYGKYASDESYASMVEKYESFTNSNANISLPNYGHTGRWTKLLSDVEGKYLNIGRSNNLTFDSRSIFTVNTTESLEDKTPKTVFETDIHWGEHNDALNGYHVAFFRLVTESNVDAGTIYLYVSADGKLYFGNNVNKGTDYAIDVGEWANLRIEIIDTTIYVYVNGDIVYTDSGTTVTAENVVSVQLEIRGASFINSSDPAGAAVFSLSLDNTFCARIENK